MTEEELDAIMPVHIGDYVMIGPNTLITTVNRCEVEKHENR